MLAWNLFFTLAFLIYISDMLIDNYTVTKFLSLTIICPLFGVLSDCHTGRLKVLKAATYFLLVAVVLKGVTIITTSPVALYLTLAMWTLSFACYLTCVIQFTTDQLIGTSWQELSFVTYWLLWGFTTGDLIHKCAKCLPRLNDWKSLILTFAVSIATFIMSYIMIENCSHVLRTPCWELPEKVSYLMQWLHLLGGGLVFTYWL